MAGTCHIRPRGHLEGEQALCGSNERYFVAADFLVLQPGGIVSVTCPECLARYIPPPDPELAA